MDLRKGRRKGKGRSGGEGQGLQRVTERPGRLRAGPEGRVWPASAGGPAAGLQAHGAPSLCLYLLCCRRRRGRSERRAPGRAASARPLRAQAQADPHGLLALAAPAAGARLREEPLRGGRRAEAAGRQPQPLGDAGNNHPAGPRSAREPRWRWGGQEGPESHLPLAFPGAPSHPVPKATLPRGLPAKPVS